MLDSLHPAAGAAERPRSFDHFHDSAIWSGHFLAGEVLRGLAGDAAAFPRVAATVEALHRLANLTPRPGLLSRVLVKTDDPALVAALDLADHADRIFTSSDGLFLSQSAITRDQYAGALLGQGIAALLLPDAQRETRERARRSFLEMVDYLEQHQFCAEEARPEPSGFQRTSTTWVLQPFQLLAISKAAAALDPERFGPTHARLRPLAAISWLFLWLQTLDPHGSYFNFNLEHSLALLLALAEPDLAERHHLLQGFRVQRRACGSTPMPTST